jgi:hypothetical protein
LTSTSGAKPSAGNSRPGSNQPMSSGASALASPVGIGQGYQFPFRAANPGAGSLLTVNMDGQFVRRILSLVFTVTAANAGSSRYVAVEYRGKDGLPFSVNAPASLLAINSGNRYAPSIAYSLSDFATGTDVFFPLDPVLLYPGDQLVINITTLDAGDAITNIRGVEERFPPSVAQVPDWQGV